MNCMQFMGWSFTTWSGNGCTNHFVNYRGQTGYKFSSQNLNRGEVNVLTRSFGRSTYSTYNGMLQQTGYPLYYGQSYVRPSSNPELSSNALTHQNSLATSMINTLAIQPPVSEENESSSTAIVAIPPYPPPSLANSKIVAVPPYPPPNVNVRPYTDINYVANNTTVSIPSVNPNLVATPSRPSITDSAATLTIPSYPPPPYPSVTSTPDTSSTAMLPFTRQPPPDTYGYYPLYVPTPDTTEYNIPSYPPPIPVPTPTQNSPLYVPTSTVNFAPTYIEGYEPTHLVGYIPAQMTGYSQIPDHNTYTPTLVNEVYYGNVPVYAYQRVQEEEEAHNDDVESEQGEENTDENHNNEDQENENNITEDGTKSNFKEKLKKEEKIKKDEIPENKTPEENASGKDFVLDKNDIKKVEENNENADELIPIDQNVDDGNFNERYPRYNYMPLPFYEGVNYVALPYAGNNYVPLPPNQHFEEIEQRHEGTEEGEEDRYEYTLGDYPLLNMPEL